MASQFIKLPVSEPGVAVVTSVAIAGGPQISVSGSPITSAGTITLGIPASVTVSALNINWAQGNVFIKALTNGVFAITFSNQADGQTIVVKISTTGSTVINFPAGIKWPGGSQPTPTSNGVDVYTFIDISGTIYASVVQGLA